MSNDDKNDEQPAVTKLQSYITDSGLPVGPQSNISYPISVLYCGNCGLPVEVYFFFSKLKRLENRCFLYTSNIFLPQYCEYYAEYDKCKEWFEKNLPAEFAKQARIGNLLLLVTCEARFILFYVLCAETAEDEGPKTDGGEAPKEGEDDKKRQKRGGKGLSKPKKKEGGPKKICLSVAPRGRKRLTVVTGLKSYGILI
jgi:hypothetical protein